MTAEARRILVEAKGLVVHGWFAFRPSAIFTMGESPHHCVLSAVAEVGPRREVYVLLARAAGWTPGMVSGLDRWNDAHARATEHVVTE